MYEYLTKNTSFTSNLFGLMLYISANFAYIVLVILLSIMFQTPHVSVTSLSVVGKAPCLSVIESVLIFNKGGPAVDELYKKPYKVYAQ